MQFMANLRDIRLFVFDVDGVLTDGQLYFSDQGEEMKTFYVQDGLGIKHLQQLDIETAIITARNSPLVAHRANNLGIHHLYQGQKNKQIALMDLLGKLNLTLQQTAYMGDDLIDLPALTRVGWAVAPANAHPSILPHVHWQTQAYGGKGAVREAIDRLIHLRGQSEQILAQYLNP